MRRAQASTPMAIVVFVILALIVLFLFTYVFTDTGKKISEWKRGALSCGDGYAIQALDRFLYDRNEGGFCFADRSCETMVSSNCPDGKCPGGEGSWVRVAVNLGCKEGQYCCVQVKDESKQAAQVAAGSGSTDAEICANENIFDATSAACLGKKVGEEATYQYKSTDRTVTGTCEIATEGTGTCFLNAGICSTRAGSADRCWNEKVGHRVVWEEPGKSYEGTCEYAGDPRLKKCFVYTGMCGPGGDENCADKKVGIEVTVEEKGESVTGTCEYERDPWRSRNCVVKTESSDESETSSDPVNPYETSDFAKPEDVCGKDNGDKCYGTCESRWWLASTCEGKRRLCIGGTTSYYQCRTDKPGVPLTEDALCDHTRIDSDKYTELLARGHSLCDG